MGKAEEYLAKKRNKAARKRMSNTVDFTKGVQAAKRRRKAGRRRHCEGMCYSLPTPEDPFNELYKEKLAKKKAKKAQDDEDHDLLNATKASKTESNHKVVKNQKSKINGRRSSAESNKVDEPRDASPPKKSEVKVANGLVFDSGLSNHPLANGQIDTWHRQSSSLAKIKWKPSCENCSKNNNTWTCIGGGVFEVALCTLLNANMINDEEPESDTAVEQKMLLEKKCIGSKWDWQFWEACGTGSDVLATRRTSDTLTQRSCVVGAVSHVGVKRECQIRIKDPLVLFLVQSKEQSLQVRSIFKVLKPLLGVHAVALHTQTPLQRQIEGLRSTEVEVLVATPERLCELLSVNAISLSNISFMVIDGVEEMVSCDLSDTLLHIKARIPENVQTVILSERFPHSTLAICQKLLKDPICRVTATNTSLSQYCACLSQNVNVLVTEDKRQQKLKRLLREHIESRENGATLGGLLVLFRHSGSLLHVKDMIEGEGYSVDTLSNATIDPKSASAILEQFRNGHVEVLLATEDCAGGIDLGEIGIIVLYEFTASMELYRKTLMRMARYTINGVLYSFCSGATAPLTSQLIDVLQECLQPIPPSLRMLADAAQLVEQRRDS